MDDRRRLNPFSHSLMKSRLWYTVRIIVFGIIVILQSWIIVIKLI